MKKIVIVSLFLFVFQLVKAQENVITTGVPFLLIAADARAAGVADMGAATSADVFSQQYNPSKYAFATTKYGASVSYTPYLTSIANDISLGQVTFYDRFNERSAFAASLRYFGLGDITITDDIGTELYKVNPNELAFDLSYALKLSDQFSMGVAGRYIRSNLKIPDGNTDASSANSFAVDVSGFYQSEEFAMSDFNARYRIGLNLQNMGPKISYDGDVERSSNFLPANFKLGGSFDFILDDYNKITALAEINKLMVPTPQEVGDEDGNGVIDETDEAIVNEDYRQIGWFEGMFKSFGDAPGGFSEEMKEIAWALGAEYWYQESFAFRTGYFHESPDKGARQYATIGAGFKYNTVKVDVSYLFSTSTVRNPLENTLRFSLTFSFGDSYDEY
ncbi:MULTISPECIES: type IX secretion system outer membrane channel protein PorV [Flavobacterium]|uniref:type IX secretion system outer membrane channel protein PorV n=1 Tax=Flavobacterium TaxID=237 RepID=UPI001FCB7D7A|nr:MULTISPECIES: type IX secretion system outer membrane channel protein PorV [Flavobacterium]UOK43626.1 type IX secretion system outer membrane channel protein PorV [Flavobacterium enshiense]